MNYINKLEIFSFSLLLIFFVNFSGLQSQERFLLTEAEMAGYELKRQSTFYPWIIGEGNQIHDAIQQKWHVIGGNVNDNIYIGYCEFITVPEAIYSTAYTIYTYATPSFWGSITGSIFGDRSWVSVEDGDMFFVRGNVGIKIGKPFFKETDRSMLVTIADKLLTKIENNLSPEIISVEEAARQKQIPLVDYQKITEPVVNSEEMSGFLIHTTWDSKWLADTTTLIIGRRSEWKNEQETLIGIDICTFDSAEQAKQAAEIQSKQTFGSIFNLDSLASLEKIITEWQNKRKYGLENNFFSVVAAKSNLAVHIYQFDSTMINTDFTYSVVEKLAEQIINF